MVALNRDSQSVRFVQPNTIYRPGLSVGEDHGFADKLPMGVLKLVENSGRADFRSWHGDPRQRLSGLVCIGKVRKS